MIRVSSADGVEHLLQVIDVNSDMGTVEPIPIALACHRIVE